MTKSEKLLWQMPSFMTWCLKCDDDEYITIEIQDICNNIKLNDGGFKL